MRATSVTHRLSVIFYHHQANVHDNVISATSACALSAQGADSVLRFRARKGRRAPRRSTGVFTASAAGDEKEEQRERVQVRVKRLE